MPETLSPSGRRVERLLNVGAAIREILLSPLRNGFENKTPDNALQAVQGIANAHPDN